MSVTFSRIRGDNYPITATIKVNGELIDLTGSTMTFSYKSGSEAKKSIDGSLTANKGEVEFYPDATDFQIAGQYLFDIQREIGGIISTHLRGTMLLEEDIT